MWFSLSSQVISDPKVHRIATFGLSGRRDRGHHSRLPPVRFPVRQGGSPTVAVYSAPRLAGSHIRLEGQPNALVRKRAGDALTVLLAYALSAGHFVPPLPHGCLHAAPPVPANHRKIAPLETHHDRWSEVVRRRALPILAHGDHGVIARMIVTV